MTSGGLIASRHAVNVDLNTNSDFNLLRSKRPHRLPQRSHARCGLLPGETER